MITAEKIRKMHPPTPERVRRELDRLGLSQTEGAALLRVNERTMRRYLQDPGSPGSTPMPFGSFALLRMVEKENA